MINRLEKFLLNIKKIAKRYKWVKHKTQPKKALNNNEVAFTPTIYALLLRIGRGVISIWYICNRVDIRNYILTCF